jgi:hypothetical protein
MTDSSKTDANSKLLKSGEVDSALKPESSLNFGPAELREAPRRELCKFESKSEGWACVLRYGHRGEHSPFVAGDADIPLPAPSTSARKPMLMDAQIQDILAIAWGQLNEPLWKAREAMRAHLEPLLALHSRERDAASYAKGRTDALKLFHEKSGVVLDLGAILERIAADSRLQEARWWYTHVSGSDDLCGPSLRIAELERALAARDSHEGSGA